MHWNRKIFYLLQLATTGRANQDNMANNCWWCLSFSGKYDRPRYYSPSMIDKISWRWSPMALALDDWLEPARPLLHNTSIMTVYEAAGRWVAIQVRTLVYGLWGGLFGSLEFNNRNEWSNKYEVVLQALGAGTFAVLTLDGKEVTVNSKTMAEVSDSPGLERERSVPEEIVEDRVK